MFNDAQIEAISTRVPTVLVSAGAGSGKTRVLTERYFHLLDDVIDGRKTRLDEILTLTFTRKAAQEMRERIAKKLEEEGRAHERRELSRAPIGTIHSFCESILREHALEAGIDPNFRLLDEAEARTLQENALDTIFENLWSGTQQEREEIGRLILDTTQKTLRSSLMDLYSTLRTNGSTVESLTLPSSSPLAPVTTEFVRAVDDLLSLEGTAKWQENLRQMEETFAILRPKLENVTDFQWETYDLVKGSVKSLTPSGGPKTVAKEAREAIKAAAENWLSAYLDRLAQPYLEAFRVLLGRFDREYRAAKDTQGLLDFEDLLLCTRSLLTMQDGSAATRLRTQFRQIMVDEFQDTNTLQFDIIRALQGDGHLFMVGDVKQAIYRFIGSDITVFLGQEKRVLDMPETTGLRIAMQSNYRSRPEVLEPLNGFFDRLWPLGSSDDGFTFEPLTAGSTFLTKEIPSIECAFWDGAEASLPELREREARWIARRILQLTGTIGNETLTITERVGEQGELIGRQARFGDVILLFRASSDIELYEDALRQAGIPFYVVSGRGFYQTREVQDILYLLRALENPMDDFALAVVLRSPLVAVSDDTLYWLSRDWSVWQEGQPYPTETARTAEAGRIWSAIDHVEDIPPIADDDRQALLMFRHLVLDLQYELPAGQPLDLIDSILTRTGYASVLLATNGGDQRYANVQKLREVAATFQARGIFDLSDFQRYLTQLSTRAPREASAPLDVEGSNVVRLMTVHASKGLEAPIVFLADGGREPVSISDQFLIAAGQLVCQVPSPDGGMAKPAAYRQVQQALTTEDLREGERLLYVALTRAREHLICCGATKFPEREKCVRYADILAWLLGLSGPIGEDTDVPITFEKTTHAVRVWSPASLTAVEELAPPAPAPTLWDEYADAVLTGGELPLLTDEKAVEGFARITDRLQPLAITRREGPLRVGVHRALCYNSCPRQYWFRYVLDDDGAILPSAVSSEEYHIPERTDVDDETERMDGTAYGQLLHAVMQRLDFTIPLIEQVPGTLEEIVAETTLEPSEADQRAIVSSLERFMTMPIYPMMRQATEIHRELRFLAREGSYYVPGIIDALVKHDGEWWLVDYKTGKPSANHMRQLAIYALGINHTLSAPPAKVALAYLDETGKRNLRIEEVTAAHFDEARRLIRTAGDGIRAEGFTPSPGSHCTWCPYAGVCPDQGTEQLALF